MVKSKSSETVEQTTAKKSNFKGLLMSLIVVAALAGGGYEIWKNPQIVQQIKTMFGQEDAYQKQIDALNAKISELQQNLTVVSAQIKEPDLSGFEYRVKTAEDKVAAMETLNLNVINSKADVATVLGVITRMDKAEQRLDKITAVDDESAIILTAAMLVKDSAERGGSFEYEAEVLSNVAANQPKLKRQIEKLQSFAKDGIVTELQLASEFEGIYAEMQAALEKDTAKNWKERLNNKIGEIVQIKKANENTAEAKEAANLAEIKALVGEGRLMEAADMLEKVSGAENKKAQDWVAKVRNYNDFYDIIRQISASSLAVMKVNFLKKKGL